MKIYLDAGFASEHGGGIGTYSRALAEELSRRGYVVIQPRLAFTRRIPNRALRRILYTLRLWLVLPVYLRWKGVEVAHFTNLQTPLWRNGATRYVTTVHDLAPIRFPETVPGLYRIYFRWALTVAVATAHAIVTVTESVRRDLIDLYDLPPERVGVGYCYTRQDALCTGRSLARKRPRCTLEPRAYFLCVGRLELRKNLTTVVRAFSAYKAASGSSTKLVLVGRPGFGFERIRERIEESPYKEDIVLPGYVSDEELAVLYTHSLAVVFASVYEGFGLPLLEAMLFRRPIVASRIPTSLEILDSRAYFFEKNSVEELRSQLAALESMADAEIDYRDILQRYSKDEMLRRHIAIYTGSQASSERCYVHRTEKVTG